MASAATPPAAHSTPPRFVPSYWRCSVVSTKNADAGDDLRKSDATSLRWRSAGGSETVLQILDAVLGTREISARHWPY